MTTLRSDMDANVRALITHLTDFDPENPTDYRNFNLCYAYVSSNLLYHRFFEPDERKISSHFEGLRQKLQVHADRERADALAGLLQAYNAAGVFKRPHPQYDIKTRLLSLLWHLSESPLGKEWSREDLDAILEAAQRDASNADGGRNADGTDWRALLKEGEDAPARVNWGSDSELSEWSEDEVVNLSEDNTVGDDAFEPDVPRSGAAAERPETAEEADAWLRAHVQTEYWKQNEPAPAVSSLSRSANLVRTVETLLMKKGITPNRSIVLSEYQLLREILMSVREPASSTVFHLDSDSGHFSVVEGICIPSVMPIAMRSCLAKICDLLSVVLELQTFCKDVFRRQSEADSVNVPACFTYEAYANTLNNELSSVFKVAVELERRVQRQEETYTLLNLIEDLSDSHKTLKTLHSTHVRSVEPLKSAMPNWIKSLKLIAGIDACLVVQSKRNEFNLLLGILLKTYLPYFQIIDIWLREGRLEDLRDEFIYCKATGVESKAENFWQEGITVRASLEDLHGQGIQLPKMLRTTLPLILLCGKSIEILTFLNLRAPSEAWALQSSLHAEFVKSLEKGLECRLFSDGHSQESTPAGQKSCAAFEVALAHLELDEYMKHALALACDGDTVSATSPHHRLERVSPNDAEAIMPLEEIMEQALNPLIESSHSVFCSALLVHIRDTLQLHSHLVAVRKIFLMEAGDVLLEFCADIFRRMNDDPESLDSASVTLFLQDCIAKRYSKISDRFAFTAAEQRIEEDQALLKFPRDVVLSYYVEWPISMILSGSSLRTYNAVFMFLLDVKRALWTLQQINAKSLSTHRAEEEAVSDEDTDESKEKAALPVHRILLLRSWLFHFVGNVHSYFMTRVLHSTELELRAGLEQSSDLDQLLATHDSYISSIYDRCFLHPSAKILREAILKVLGMCFSLSDLCKQSPPSRDSLESLEKLENTYVRAHHFLASSLCAMVKKRNVPHLEGLTVALVHSSPQRIV